MKYLPYLAAVAVTAVAPATIASAQAPATTSATATASVTAGATVYDTTGGVVGTVSSVTATAATIDTGTVKATIPFTSFGAGEKGPVLAMTKAQIEAAAAQQQASAAADFKAKLVPGAAVYGTGGVQLGTIKSVDAGFVTVTTAAGAARLPVSGFGPGPNGVTIGLTAAQLAAAMGKAVVGSAVSGLTGAAGAVTGAVADTATAPATTGAQVATGTSVTTPLGSVSATTNTSANVAKPALVKKLRKRGR